MRIVQVVVLVIATTAFADDLPPGVSAKDAALVDRLVASIERVLDGMHAVRGSCDKVAAAMTRTMATDNKLLEELVPKMEAPNSKPLQQYAQGKYKPKLKPMREKSEAATLGCRTNKAVADAWTQNKLMIETFGKLPPEPEKAAPKPPGYEAKTKVLDAALAEYKAVADKLWVEDVKECAAAAKLLKRFAAAKRRVSTLIDGLDKATQQAVLADDEKMKNDSGSYINFMATRNRCQKSKPFMKAVKAAGLSVPKS